MPNKLNVAFILDHDLKKYRIPFFEQLSERGYNIIVCHPGNHMSEVVLFKQIKTEILVRLLGVEYRNNILVEGVDVIVYMQNIRIANLWVESFKRKRKYKLIQWGIGVSSSNGLSLKKTLASRIRNCIAKKSDAMILYSSYPLSLFSKDVKKKTFVANNTIYNPDFKNYSRSPKDSFIFIGALDRRKGLGILLEVYKIFLKQTKREIPLIIIGDGKERKSLELLSKYLDIENQVIFKGPISEAKIKEHYFMTAIATISLFQAGLSVLESFSYGIPFISFENAISGGEHLNIKDMENGCLVNSKEDLLNKLIILSENNELSSRLGDNAYHHYKERRQMKHMVDEFEKAFEFVLK